MPRFLLTGLCLQGNKGGPALALSLIEQIKQQIPDAEFTLSVPGEEEEWVHELRAAKDYDLKIVKNISLRHAIPPFNLKGDRARDFKAWWQALRHSDVLIQMSAICYYGPPSGAGSIRAMVGSSRFQDLFFSTLARRPMRAWTQSYGPFSTSAVRCFARFDLARQPIVFCRGDDCREAVAQLLGRRARVLSFPDVAVTLPYDSTLGQNYLKQTHGLDRSFLSLSPSAVMYRKSSGKGVQNGHVLQIKKMIEEILTRGYEAVLIPHTFRPSNPDPNQCDFVVAELVKQTLKDKNVHLILDDLSPIELKSIISLAKVHIGARYHSLVAALSSNVPAISISWHGKYLDLMRQYGKESNIINGSDFEGFSSMLDSLIGENVQHRRDIMTKQNLIVERVLENTKLFSELLMKS